MANHYASLGVWRDATQDEVKASYRRLVSLHHPDRNGGSADSAARFIEIQAAYDVLGDAARRRRYDASLRPTEPNAESAAPSAVPAVSGPRDRPNLRSLAALGLGVTATALLVAGLVLQHASSLHWRTLLELRLAALVLGVAAARLARAELQKLMRLAELHTNGFGAVVDLPAVSRASRTAARCGWLLGRAAPVGFLLLTLAAVAQQVQQFLPILQSLQDMLPSAR